MRSTLDNWIYSLFNEKPKEDDDGADTDEMLSDSLAMTQQRFDTQKQMWLHGLLILLHSPFMNHELAQKSVSSSTSLEICYYSATIITDIAERLIRDDVFFFSRSCINIYATIKALQIHSMGAGHLKDQKFTVFSQLNFEKTIAMLRKLPQHCHGTMLTDVVEASEKKFYEQRQNPTSCVSNLGNAGEFRKPSSDTMDDSPNNHCNSRSISIQDPNRHHGKRSHPISKPSSKPPFKIICFDPSSRIITRDKPHMKVEVSRQLDNNNPEPLEYAHPPHPPTPLSASAQLAYQPVSPAQPPLMPYMDQHSCSTISTENTPLILYHDPFFSAASANPLFSGHAEEGSVPHTTISANTLPSWNNDTFVSNYSLFPTQ
ncbi:uncharacterized protein BYT42DRAFT_251252 [Radiomyces spectabilis]|uniref:uncharacterized protein n=1 Tax=Radiomyces spectabilis TaxID=64574 RepID=UPI00221E516B|nr:uncharacterized protein BYT42DRAFT_251252 [Radiomyces spectabilis]KAI8388892.1 hypothetical protein BYT42DRAFT_251252 [Radiomyces spectabilis]